MRVKEYFRGGKISRGLEVTKNDLKNILEVSPYVSVSDADKNVLKNQKMDEIVGVIMGDIDNILFDLQLGNRDELALVENPDCWFVNKDFINKNYKDLETSKFTFGEAIELLKLRFKVAREGWNGKNMWLIYVPASFVKVKKGIPYGDAGLAGKEIRIDAHIDMYTAQGTMQPGWLASQADMLAEDWIIVN